MFKLSLKPMDKVLVCKILNVFDKLADLRSKPCAPLFSDLDKVSVKIFCFNLHPNSAKNIYFFFKRTFSADEVVLV